MELIAIGLVIAYLIGYKLDFVRSLDKKQATIRQGDQSHEKPSFQEEPTKSRDTGLPGKSSGNPWEAPEPTTTALV